MKILDLITNTKTTFLYKVIFTGFRDEDQVSLGGHYSDYYTLEGTSEISECGPGVTVSTWRTEVQGKGLI